MKSVFYNFVFFFVFVRKMRYVRTLRGLLLAPAIAVTREMKRSVEVAFQRRVIFTGVGSLVLSTYMK